MGSCSRCVDYLADYLASRDSFAPSSSRPGQLFQEFRAIAGRDKIDSAGTYLMSNHRMAFVPIECWAFSSPDQMTRGFSVDLGLFCESLIYYDQVVVTMSNEPQFAAFVEWFKARGRFHDLLKMLSDGTVTVF